MQPEYTYNAAPVAIGGVGGSGTGVVAQLVANMGLFIGDTLNRSNDNLTFIKSRQLLSIEDEQLRRLTIANELAQFEQRMVTGFLRHGEGYYRNWGWKVPGQFHILAHTAEYFPELKYVHVMRHGLDMAFSKNRNQLRNWGPMMGVTPLTDDDPVAVLEYWVLANEKALELGRRLLGERFHVLNYDRLCREPEDSVRTLAEFVLGETPGAEELERLCEVVSSPPTVNRYQQHNVLELFPTESLDRVRAMGFDIEVANARRHSAR